ncbi:uncharacterized protein [Rutidosis leptorrhynchoides]|uniref:uncharacterized protein n=1 Tax=Rutidosis leptorrhynchoides TaxID=125765 RepID=UPI003A997E15
MNILSLNIRGVGQDGKVNWMKKLCLKEKPIILCLQETKSGELSELWIKNIWGSSDFNYIQKNAQGFSGVEGEFCLGIKGNIEGIDSEVAVVNVYGPHSTTKKIRFWESLEKLLSFGDMPWLLCGDFNEVGNPNERMNSEFNKSWADRFNKFINYNCLIDVSLGEKKFTRICDNGVKFSKLDRFLISEQFRNLWPNISAVTLDKHLSDHSPVLLSNGLKDFGPSPLESSTNG